MFYYPYLNVEPNRWKPKPWTPIDPFDKTEKKTNHSLSQQLSLINTLNLTDHDSL